VTKSMWVLGIVLCFGLALTAAGCVLAYSPLVTEAGVLCGTLIAPEPELAESAQRPCAALADARRPVAATVASVALGLLLAVFASGLVAARRAEKAVAAQ